MAHANFKKVPCITPYTADTTAPYMVSNQSRSINEKVSLHSIAERLELDDGLTHEESRVQDTTIVKYFQHSELSDEAKVKECRQHLREGKTSTKGKRDHRIGQYHGGVRKVYNDGHNTWVKISYR